MAVNDYVFASRWPDKDWNDPWCIGYILEETKDRVLLHDGRCNIIGRNRRWPCWEVISEGLGRKIIESYPQLEGQPFDEELFNKLWHPDHAEEAGYDAAQAAADAAVAAAAAAHDEYVDNPTPNNLARWAYQVWQQCLNNPGGSTGGPN